MKELDRADYSKVVNSLRKVKINNLFARAVVESNVPGIVYVDDTDTPATFYVIHSYGMSLLFGKHDNQAFNQAFKEHALNKNHLRNSHEWMQAYPEDWHAVLKELFADCLIKSSEKKPNQGKHIIELNTRVNFKFNREKYREFKRDMITPENQIVKTGKKEFECMQGSVIPLNFWDNANDFIANGIGFSTYSGDELACTAFAAYIMDNYLELGMETVPEFRGKGFAQFTCSKLINYCLENNYEPIWACRLENIGSYKLAQKLGFDISKQIPYYRLSN